MRCFLTASRLLFLVLLMFLGTHLPVLGQQHKSPSAWILGGTWQQGSILVHTGKIRHLAGLHPSGWELNLQRQTRGTRYWQELYHYPRLGLSFVFLDYGNTIVGKSLALSPYLSLPLRRAEKSQLHFRFGSGLAFFSNKYYRYNNPANNIISATYNAVIQTRLEYEYQLGSKMGLLAGAGLNHYSNGGYAKPNLGVNIATASLGLNFYGAGRSPAVNQAVSPETVLLQRPGFFSISSSVGVKQRSDHDTLKYVVHSLALAMSRRLNQKSTLMLGLEGFYDPSLYPRRAWDPRVKPGSEPDIRRVALNLGHELNLGKLAFGAQLGYYFYRPYKADAVLYQRLETRYYFHRYAFIAAGLKLHDVIKADLIEYRLGLRI